MTRKNVHKFSRFPAAVLIAGLSCSAMADHALLTNGRILYNVVLPENATTGGALLRIRTTPSSFGFDPRTNAVTAVSPFSVTERVEDYISTATTVGREKAVGIVQSHHWDVPRPRRSGPPLVAPPPAPKFTPAPIVFQPRATPVPLNVVSDTLPLQDRLDKQLDIFMKEQTTLARDGGTSVVQGIVTAEQLKAAKLRLLQQQKSILTKFYPQNEESVKLSVEYWEQQISRLQTSGKFDLENL